MVFICFKLKCYLVQHSNNNSVNQLLSTILRHDRKQNSYKIALVRAINDVVLNYPFVSSSKDVAIPLRLLADKWIAYFWPFVSQEEAIRQGNAAKDKNDISFRPELSQLRSLWESHHQTTGAQEGFLLVDLMMSAKPKETHLQKAYKAASSKIMTALRQPIQYAGEGQWNSFTKPIKAKDCSDAITLLPATQDNDTVLIVNKALWTGFQELSLWIEALCIHEWSLLTVRFAEQEDDVTRGTVYELLTSRPDNRRPLTWERNHIDILFLEGHTFTCPWTYKTLSSDKYDLDHLLPIAVYPTNELWNLVPSDSQFNQHNKRDKIASQEKLEKARPMLEGTYNKYLLHKDLSIALQHSAQSRFGTFADLNTSLLSTSVTEMIAKVGDMRNVARF